MAKPQLENGHTRIANEILEHLMRLHLAPNQWQVLLCVIRKTYGFHKKVDHIANSQIVGDTGLCKAVVSRALHDLACMGVIARNGKIVGLQKDWEQWQKLAESSTYRKLAISSILDTKLAEQLTGKKLAISPSKLAKSSTKVSSCAVTQKIKDTIQKKEYGEFSNVLLTDGDYQKLVERFGDKGTDERIENLSRGIASKGYKYKSHYATILNWDRREIKINGAPAKSGGRLSAWDLEELKNV